MHLDAQGLKISAKHGGGKEEGELQDVTGLPKKTLDTSLFRSCFSRYLTKGSLPNFASNIKQIQAN